MAIIYPDSLVRDTWVKHGERVSVKDFGAVSDGVADCSAAFQAAYDSVVSKGGGSIDIPGVGTVGESYKLNTPIVLDSDVPISWLGQGRSSKVKRGGALPAGKGLFTLTNPKNLAFRNFLIDGAVTTSAGLLYSEFANDPMHPTLTLNTSFWVQGGEDLEWDGVHIEHTGGYSVLLDARLLNVRRVKFHHGMLRNNRPHTFGTAAADMMDARRRVQGVKIDWERHFPSLLAGSASIYGSWTGGILGQNQATGGSSTKVSDLNVSNNRFERNTGNCVWQHGYGFDSFHQQIHVDNNSFLDCGLDGILFGNVIGGSAIGNSFRRIGYICSDDTSAGVPRWLPNLNATGIDTSGVVKLVTYANNSFLNVNGGAINGDGFAYGTITGNSIRVSRPGEPEYSEDSIGSGFGPGGAGANWSQGIVLGNTADKEGGLGVTISGNFCDNLGGTAIGLYAARKCQAQNNLIIAPNAPGQNPIMIGGLLTGSNQVARDNLVTENTVHFNPAQPAPAIFEDPTYRPFTSADINNVIKNYIVGTNAFEFQRNTNSQSSAALFFTTSGVTTSQSRHGMQREGIGAGSALRWYAQDGDPFGWLHMQLQMYWALSQRGPLLNVAEWGPGVEGEGGCITTGNVTSMPFANAMATSKLSASGFLAMGDATFWEVEANLLPSVDVPGSDGWALLRWDGLLSKWQQSVEGGGAAGPRIWTDFGAGGTGAVTKPADPVDSVQFNRAGAFGGSANFLYTESIKRVTVICDAATPGINVAGGYISSAQGFVAMPATAVTYNAIQASNGGVFALSATIKNYITWGSNAAPVPTINDTFLDNGVINYDDPNKIFNFRTGQYNQATQNTDLVDVSCFALGFAASSPLTNAIQAPAGGVTAQWLIAQDSLIFIGRAQPPLSGMGQARIYAATSGQLYISTNTAPYGPFGNTPPGAPEGSVQYNRGGQFGGDANFFWDEGVNRLYITCAPGFPSINTSGGWIQSEGGFLTFNTGTAINAPDGVVNGRYLSTGESLIFKGQATAPGLSTAGGTGQVRLYASSGGQMYVSSNGAAWGPFGTGTPPASSDGAIQYNDAGSFGGHPNFYWHKTAFQMYLNTYAGQSGLTVTGGWIQSQGGFMTDNATALAVNAQSGGVTARWIAANESLLFLQRAEPDRSTGGQVRLYANTNGVLYISTGGQPYGPLVTSALAAGTHSMVQYNNSGYFGAEAAFYYNDSSDTLTVPNITATGTTWGSVSSSGVISAVRFYSNVGDGEWQYLMNSPWRQWGFRTGADGSQQWVDYSGGNAPLQIYGHTSPASIRLVTGGSVQANQFYSPYAGFDAVNAGNGGSYARSHRSAVYTQIGQNYGQGIAFTGGDSLQFGCLFYDTSVGVAKIYISSGWQAIATGTFSGITSTTQPSWTATNSGYSYTFNNSNGNFVVNGQGDVTAYGVITTTGPSGGFNCTGQQAKNSIQTYGGFNAGSGGGGNGVYQIGGSDVINNSRQFVGYGGVNTSGNLQSSAGTVIAPYYQVTGGYYGQDATGGIQVGGSAPAKTLYFKSGILYYVA